MVRGVSPGFEGTGFGRCAEGKLAHSSFAAPSEDPIRVCGTEAQSVLDSALGRCLMIKHYDSCTF